MTHSHESTQVKVGIFVFSGVLIAMVIIFLLGGKNQLFERQYSLQASFQDISGLRVGAPVQLAGLRIGMVEKISLGEDLEEKKIWVSLAISKSFQNRIRADSVASITTQGLLGDKTVSISIGSPGNEILKNGEIIKSEERPSLFSIAEKGGAIMGNIDKAAKGVARLLEHVETGEGLLHTLIYEEEDKPVARDIAQMARELSLASREVRQIMQKVNRGEGTIGALLADPSVYNDIRRLFGKLERNSLLRHVIRSRIRDLELEKSIQEPRH